MKKKKWKVVCLVVLILALVAAIAVAVFAAIKKTNKSGVITWEEQHRKIAEENPDISLDEETCLLFKNNEVVVISKSTADYDDMEYIANQYDAKIIDSMEDAGIYCFKFEKAMSMEEIEKNAKSLKKSASVEDAFVNLVSVSEEDVEDKDAVYPNDEWDKPWWVTNLWDVGTPRDSNWGVEAIHAPEAWAYLDELEEVNVGLIDFLPNGQHEDLEIKGLRTTVNESTNYYETEEFELLATEADDHGTHVAGTIGAKYNNRKGISGILGDKGNMYYSVVAGREVDCLYSSYEYVRAISALVENDVRVINISLNTVRTIGFAATQGNKAAIEYIKSHAKVVEKMLSRLIERIEKNNGKDFVLCISAGNINGHTYYKDNSSWVGYVEDVAPSIFSKGYKGGALAQYNNFMSYIENEKVKDRIIVVGSVGIDNPKSTNKYTRYKYSDFACIGERVDVVAPGEDIYSLKKDGYKSEDGTSMAAPHVSGVAGLAFAANPALTGPQVKAMVTSLTSGRYFFGDVSRGMVDAEKVVKFALDTKDGKAAPVTNKRAGLDLCFVVDTTGSMGDDIDNAKENMVDILTKLSEKTSNYQVALVDYRDFADRTSYSEDYPAKIQLEFSSDQEEIKEAINGLSLGNGGDGPETVYSGIAEALSLKWRDNAKRVIIILGDAKPLDPEPYTDYTYDDVLLALYNADVGIDTEKSDSRVLGEPDASAVNVYSIGVGSTGSDFFESVSTDTGGAYTEVGSADEVSDAIIESIDKIEVTTEAETNFGSDYSGEMVDLFIDGEYQFSFTLNENGEFLLDEMDFGEYDWRIQRLGKYGTLEIEEGEEEANITENEEWYTFAMVIWYRHKLLLFAGLAGVIILIVVLVKAIKKLKNRPKKEKIPAPVPPSITSTMPSATQNVPAGNRKFCRQCGNAINPNDAFCQKCGSPVPKESKLKGTALAGNGATAQTQSANTQTNDKKFCQTCGSELEPGHAFCMTCGTPVNK